MADADQVEIRPLCKEPRREEDRAEGALGAARRAEDHETLDLASGYPLKMGEQQAVVSRGCLIHRRQSLDRPRRQIAPASPSP